MNTANLIALAARHANKSTSAQSALTDALTTQSKGMDEAARKWALRSLGHSIGILHADYQLAVASDTTPNTIPRDRLFTRIKPLPGRSYYCGCDARTDGPEKCRQHDSPRVPAE